MKKTNKQLRSAEIIDFIEELPEYRQFMRENRYIKYGCYGVGAVVFALIMSAVVTNVSSTFLISVLILFTALILVPVCGFVPKYMMIQRTKVFIQSIYDRVEQEFGECDLDQDFEEDLLQDMIE